MHTGIKRTARPAAESRVLHRTSLSQPPLAVGGEGCWLIDAAGGV